MPKAATQTDVLVGSRVKARREQLGWSREELGAKVGVSFQQIQKYEKGINRIGAGRLYEIARSLGVPVSYFFLSPDCGEEDRQEPVEARDLLSSPGAVELLDAYVLIADGAIRRAFVDMARGLAETRLQRPLRPHLHS